MKYGLIGYSGKMGREISAVMEERGHIIVLRVDENSIDRAGVPDVIIDFSLPEALKKTFALAEEYNTPLVIGTTGLTGEQLEKIATLGLSIPVVQSFNYSVGINLLLRCVRILKDRTEGWDVEITETHHRFKRDKPSGTALMIKEELGKEVPISSLRLGNIPGDHSVVFGNLGEVLTVSHSAQSRRAFAEGAKLAAEYAVKKGPGLYSFDNVLDD